MTNTLEKVRNMIWAGMAGVSPEQWQHQQSKDNLKSTVDRFLEQNPHYLDNYPSDQSSSQPSKHPINQPVSIAKQNVRDSKQKVRWIKKSLGADAGEWHQEKGIDPEQLRLAREKCRQVVEENPEQYTSRITAATAPDENISLVQCLNRLS